MQHLDEFLTRNNIQTESVEKENVAGLLGFDGEKFRSWYEETHGCDMHPHRCDNTPHSIELTRKQ